MVLKSRTVSSESAGLTLHGKYVEIVQRKVIVIFTSGPLEMNVQCD